MRSCSIEASDKSIGRSPPGVLKGDLVFKFMPLLGLDAPKRQRRISSDWLAKCANRTLYYQQCLISYVHGFLSRNGDAVTFPI